MSQPNTPGLIKTQTYPPTPYGTTNYNQVPLDNNTQKGVFIPGSPFSPKNPLTYEASNETLPGPMKSNPTDPLVKTSPFSPTDPLTYGANSATHGPAMALRTPLLEGPPYPTTSYEGSGLTLALSDVAANSQSGEGVFIPSAPYPSVPYGPGAQTSNSQPTTIWTVFQINLQTLQYWDWYLPNRTTLDGNEVTTEEQNLTLAKVRSTWLPSLFNGVENIAHHDSEQFIAYGVKAVYLRNTFVVAGDPNSVLTVVASGDGVPPVAYQYLNTRLSESLIPFSL
jgi:hypothetical protein